jgi:hypothetical protein
VDAHDNFVSVDVDMPLHEGHWLGQDIEAGADQVHVQNGVLSDDAEDPLVEVRALARGEGHDDPSGGVGVHCAFHLAETEHILFIGYKLEGGREVGVVNDVKEPVRA